MPASKARPLPWPRLFRFWVLVLIPWAPGGGAACPPGSQFRVDRHLAEEVPVAYTDASPGGARAAVSLDLRWPLADAGLSIGGRGLSPAANLSPRRWLWRLRIPRPTTLDAADLLVSYTVTGSDGQEGVLVSALDPASRVRVRVVTRAIEQRDRGRWRQFLGFIDMDLDYGGATRAGGYGGMIATTVECPEYR